MDFCKSATAWDGTFPPRKIQQVWDYVTTQLRLVREKSRQAMEDFYGKYERMAHLGVVSEALRVTLEASHGQEIVASFADIDRLISMKVNSSSCSPRTVLKAVDVLKKYEEKVISIISKLEEFKETFENDVLDNLEIYCSNYMKLGVKDDKFFQKLRTRTLRIRDYLRDFNKLCRSLRDSSPGFIDCFCHEEFSQTVAIKFDCDRFPILRIVPDLLQKFDHVCALAQDWLRSDKVYLEEVRRQIQKTKDRIKDISGESHTTKLDYERLFALLKKKQFELEDYDESFELICKDIATMECKKTRLEIEIHAVAKTLKSCREQIRDLRSVSVTRQESREYDDVDGGAPESDSGDSQDEEVEERRITRSMGHAHSTYRTRLCKDARKHNVKLDFLKKKKRKLERKIASKKSALKEIKDNEQDIQAISKELRSIARRKAKLLEEISAMNSHLESLEQMLSHRLHPTCSNTAQRNGRPKRGHRSRSGSKIRQRNRPDSRSSLSSRGSNKRGSASRDKKKRQEKKKRQKEMHMAFRLIKNNIGQQWKDLARCLARHNPAQEIDETNTEIKAIEYENQGQLKEQAYQSLLRWYNQCGRRASMDVLNQSLRDIKENRLADSIEQEVLGVSSSAHSCRST